MARFPLSSINIFSLILFVSFNVHATQLEIVGNFGHLNVSTKNWQEMRQNKLIRQQWDISCGAAALSTLMTWYHDMPLNEKTVANALLRTTNAHRVRARGGFSLLDLKRFVEAIGFRGEGYSKMAITDLIDINKPAILPIHLYGLDHFVVYKGQVGNRFYLGDPAFGNISLTEEQLKDVWKSRIAFYVDSDEAKDFRQHAFHASKHDTSIADVKNIDWRRNYTVIPITRRSRVVMP